MNNAIAPANIQGITPEEYDLVVIGSGEGSKFLAPTLARQGSASR